MNEMFRENFYKNEFFNCQKLLDEIIMVKNNNYWNNSNVYFGQIFNNGKNWRVVNFFDFLKRRERFNFYFSRKKPPLKRRERKLPSSISILFGEKGQIRSRRFFFFLLFEWRRI